MTDSEVPQGNQDMPYPDCNCDGCKAGRLADTEGVKALSSKADTTEMIAARAVLLTLMATGDTPQALLAKLDERIEHNATGSDATKSTASMPSNGGGSQDSIDTQLDFILDKFGTATIDYTHSVIKGKDGDDAFLDALDEAKESLTAWHNTQLYTEVLELLPEKKAHKQTTSWEAGFNDATEQMKAKAKAKWGKA